MYAGSGVDGSKKTLKKVLKETAPLLHDSGNNSVAKAAGTQLSVEEFEKIEEENRKEDESVRDKGNPTSGPSVSEIKEEIELDPILKASESASGYATLVNVSADLSADREDVDGVLTLHYENQTSEVTPRLTFTMPQGDSPLMVVEFSITRGNATSTVPVFRKFVEKCRDRRQKQLEELQNNKKMDAGRKKVQISKLQMAIKQLNNEVSMTIGSRLKRGRRRELAFEPKDFEGEDAIFEHEFGRIGPGETVILEATFGSMIEKPFDGSLTNVFSFPMCFNPTLPLQSGAKWKTYPVSFKMKLDMRHHDIREIDSTTHMIMPQIKGDRALIKLTGKQTAPTKRNLDDNLVIRIMMKEIRAQCADPLALFIIFAMLITLYLSLYLDERAGGTLKPTDGGTTKMYRRASKNPFIAKNIPTYNK